MIDKPGVTHDLPTAHVAGFVSVPMDDPILVKIYALTDEEYYRAAKAIVALPDVVEALIDLQKRFYAALIHLGNDPEYAAIGVAKASAALAKAAGEA